MKTLSASYIKSKIDLLINAQATFLVTHKGKIIGSYLPMCEVEVAAYLESDANWKAYQAEQVSKRAAPVAPSNPVTLTADEQWQAELDAKQAELLDGLT